MAGIPLPCRVTGIWFTTHTFKESGSRYVQFPSS